MLSRNCSVVALSSVLCRHCSVVISLTSLLCRLSLSLSVVIALLTLCRHCSVVCSLVIALLLLCSLALSSLLRARICRPVKEPRNRFPACRAGKTTLLSYRPARLHRLAESIPRNRFLGSRNVYKYGLCFCYVVIAPSSCALAIALLLLPSVLCRHCRAILSKLCRRLFVAVLFYGCAPIIALNLPVITAYRLCSRHWFVIDTLSLFSVVVAMSSALLYFARTSLLMSSLLCRTNIGSESKTTLCQRPPWTLQSKTTMFTYPVVRSRFVGAEKEGKEDVILKHDSTIFTYILYMY